MAKARVSHKTTGAIYTPPWLVEAMLQWSSFPMQACGQHVLDPACGDGAFLLYIAKQWIEAATAAGWTAADFHQRLVPLLHGRDTDKAAVAACRAQLDALAGGWGPAAWDVFEGNALDPTVRAALQGRMDWVVGNPPYVRVHNLDPDTRTAVRALPSCAHGMTDLYLAFYDLGIEALAPGGQLQYVAPNSWMRSAAGQGLRKRLGRERRLVEVVDFKDHQVFDRVTAYVAVVRIAANAQRDPAVVRVWDGQSAQRVGTLDSNALLSKTVCWEPTIQSSIPGAPLSQLVRMSVGLATLADRVFLLKDTQGPHEAPDGHRWLQSPQGPVLIEQGLLKRAVKASTWRDEHQDQGLWMVFPYEPAPNGRQTILPESVLAARYPRGYQYLCTQRPRLDQRDKGANNPVAWYAFGRSQGLDTVFGPCLVTSPINQSPRFLLQPDPDTCMISGYALVWRAGPNTEASLRVLQSRLNTPDMQQWVAQQRGGFRGGWHAYTKASLAEFRLQALELSP